MKENKQKFLERVRVHCSDVKGTGSYTLVEGEQKLAKELVDGGEAFYSMDYDHITTYKDCHTGESPLKAGERKRKQQAKVQKKSGKKRTVKMI